MKMKIQSFAGDSEAILLESIIRISKNLWKQKKNKQRIKEERESAYLLNLYNEFVKENPIDINENEFNKVCKNSGSHLSGRDFFTLWSEEANAGL